MFNSGYDKNIKVNIYKGIKGRKEAIKKFLFEIYKSSSVTEVLMLSQSNLEWLSQDTSFSKFSINIFFKIINKINKITIMHSFNRSMSSLLNFINFWTPLYLSGKIEGYDLNQYNTNHPKITIFTIDDRVCLFSLENNDLQDCITFYYTHPDIVKSYKRTFNLMKPHSVPIHKEIDKTSMAFYINFLHLLNNSKNVYMFLNKMTTYLIPVHLYKRILKTLDITEIEQKKRLDTYKQSFIKAKNIRNFEHSIIISDYFIKQINKNKSVVYNGFGFFEQKDVIIKEELFLEHMKYLKEVSEKSKIDIRFINSKEYKNIIPNYNYVSMKNSQSIIFGNSINKLEYEVFLSDRNIITNILDLQHQNIINSVNKQFIGFKNIFSNLCNHKDIKISLNVPSLSSLTKREFEISKLIFKGMSNKEISENLFISENTTKCHIRNIYKKLHIDSRYDLIAHVLGKEM